MCTVFLDMSILYLKINSLLTNVTDVVTSKHIVCILFQQ